MGKTEAYNETYCSQVIMVGRLTSTSVRRHPKAGRALSGSKITPNLQILIDQTLSDNMMLDVGRRLVKVTPFQEPLLECHDVLSPTRSPHSHLGRVSCTSGPHAGAMSIVQTIHAMPVALHLVYSDISTHFQFGVWLILTRRCQSLPEDWSAKCLLEWIFGLPGYLPDT